MLRRIVKGTMIVGAVVLASAFGAHIENLDWEFSSDDHTGSLFSLAVPAFAQNTDADQFPNNEVGICVYVKLEQTIDLARAEAVFNGIEAREEEYVIGTVKLSSLPEDVWPHAYISSSGWIMVYFPKSEPASWIVQWISSQQDEIRTTTLRDALLQIGRDMELSTATVTSTMAYYHFQYRNATKLLIALDTTTSEDTFSYTIPSGLDLYEASLSHFSAASNVYGSSTKIGSQTILSGGSGLYWLCTRLGAQQTTFDAPHQVQVSCSSNWVGAAIVFLYQ